MARGGKARAARQAATAIAMKKAGKKPTATQKKKKGKFPGDVNHDGKITGADFKMARKRGMIK